MARTTVLLVVTALLALLGGSLALRVALMSDLHIGEGFPAYNSTDLENYSTERLRAAVARLIELHEADSIDFMFVTGDVTSSAQAAEWVKGKMELDKLPFHYYPIMGNHDVWGYNSTWNAPHPEGDLDFAATFGGQFDGLVYNRQRVYDPKAKVNSTYQNFEVEVKDENLLFLALDFNTRQPAVPGWKGALPMADLHDFPGGTMDWLRKRLSVKRDYSPLIFLLHHQPYRCPDDIPDWSFCFSGYNKGKLRDALSAAYPIDSYWGLLSGHVHLWYNGTAFDQPEWQHFRQWETDASKGDSKNFNISSAITVLNMGRASVNSIEMHWRDNGVWQKHIGS